MLLSPNAKRPFDGHTVEVDAVLASESGTFGDQIISFQYLSLSLVSNKSMLVRIVRAFLVEEAKIVKKVIKQASKPAKK